MAREIDPDAIANQTLSLDEYLYLRDRGRLPDGYPVPESGADVEPKRATTMEDETILSYPTETRVTPLEDQSSPQMGNRGGIVDDEDDESEEDYTTGWNNDKRRAELSKRGLSVTGGKEDLIARLRRHDAGELLDEDQAESEN